MPITSTELLQYTRPDAGAAASISQIEEKTGFKLPDTLSAFLKPFSGPITFNCEVVLRCASAPSFSSDGKLSIDVLFGLNDGRFGLPTVYENYSERIGRGFLPIASSPGDNLLLYSNSDAKIYFWDHEGPFEEDSSSSRINVANSVEDFFDRLDVHHPEPTSQKPKRVRLDFKKIPGSFLAGSGF